VWSKRFVSLREKHFDKMGILASRTFRDVLLSGVSADGAFLMVYRRQIDRRHVGRVCSSSLAGGGSVPRAARGLHNSTRLRQGADVHGLGVTFPERGGDASREAASTTRANAFVSSFDNATGG